jgi:hypothetical protein
MGLARNRSQNRQALARDSVAVLMKEVGRVRKHLLDPINLEKFSK